MVVEKTIAYRTRLQSNPTELSFKELRPLLAMFHFGAKAQLKVIDFGGGAGAHYFLVRKLMPSSVGLTWMVVETDSMVRAAQRLASAELQFYNKIEDAVASNPSPDVVFASGSICYTPDPLEYLESVLSAGAQRIFITRMPLRRSGEARTILQRSYMSGNGPGPLPPDFSERQVIYPVTFVPKIQFEALLQKAYVLQLSIQEESAEYYLGIEPIDLYGYELIRKDRDVADSWP
jgi:putative methyltransferase (TIGR04325 family)